MTHMPLVLASSPQLKATAPSAAPEASPPGPFAGLLAAEQALASTVLDPAYSQEEGADFTSLEGQASPSEATPSAGLVIEALPAMGQALPQGGKALPLSPRDGSQQSPVALAEHLPRPVPAREPGVRAPVSPTPAQLEKSSPGEAAATSPVRTEQPVPGSTDLSRPAVAAFAGPAAVASERGGDGDFSRPGPLETLHTRDPAGAELVETSRLTPPRVGLARERSPAQFAINQSVFDEPAWGQAMAARIQWMGQGGVHSAKLRVNPEELGGIQVQLSMQGDRASVQFQTQHSETREIIERLMPRLAQAMESQGLRLEEAKVSHHSNWSEGPASRQDQQFAEGRRGGLVFTRPSEESVEEGVAADVASPLALRPDSAVDDYA